MSIPTPPASHLNADELDEIIDFVRMTSYSNVSGPGLTRSYVEYSFCEFHAEHKFALETTVLLLSLICFVLLAVIYSKIFRCVKNVANISGETLRRLVGTTCLLLATFSVCWLPFVVSTNL